MKLVWILIVLTIAGYLGGRYVFSKQRLPAIIRDIFLTGWEFILLGVAIGPMGMDLIPAMQIASLDPFIALGLGWAGLIYGVQMSRSDLSKVDKAVMRLTFIQSAIVWAGVLVFAFALFYAIFDLTFVETFTTAFVIAAAAAISSPTALTLMAPSLPKSRFGAIRILKIIATLDVIPAIIGIGVLFCFFSAESGSQFSLNRGMAFLSLSLIMAILLAILFRLFGRDKYHDDEELTLLIGYLVLIAGMAFYIRLSPLFLSFVVGVILANVLKADDKIFKMLFSTEKPFYVILLIITGLLLPPLSFPLIIVTVLILVARLWLKIIAMEREGSLFLEEHKTAGRHAGFALVAQGALAPAIGLNYLLTYPGEGPKLAFVVIVTGMIINEILAPFLIRKTIGNQVQ
ncbi:hypothetical protein MNBD_NITROSPINAE02-2006 [hydrothermal vent metagenome]|uniref:Cation/H+ exchanger domain-containing protein n=1 Tax=hydrothermal vent metagenome TaxID=652676 RepID=A0A3B1CKX8_9ZZZZ